jgi:hypothetical protein
LDDVYDEIGKTYVDMAGAHFASASQSMKAVKKSNNPDTEIRSTIGHFRDSYNIYYKAIRRSVTNRGVIFFWEKHTSTPDCKRELNKLTCDIATIISLLYQKLGEIDNAKYWRTNAIKSFDYYADNYWPKYSELFKINKKYVYVTEQHIGRGRYQKEYRISEKGREYIKKHLKSKRNKLKKTLKF